MTSLEKANRLHEQGKDEFRAGEYDEALESFTRARHLFAEAGDRTGEIEALGSMGVVYIELEEWDKAGQSLDEALAICVEIQDRSNQGKVLGNLGMLYARQGDEEKAAEAYKESITIFRELGDRGNEKAVARQLSKLKIRKGRFLDALADYQEELEGEEAPGSAQKMARKLFRIFGRLTGGGPVEEDEDEDVIDLLPEPDEEEQYGDA